MFGNSELRDRARRMDILSVREDSDRGIQDGFARREKVPVVRSAVFDPSCDRSGRKGVSRRGAENAECSSAISPVSA